MESLIGHFEVFGLNVIILHDAAGALRAFSGKVPGHC